MKRAILLVALLASSVAALSAIGVASANGGPHGGYTTTTDRCAGCHRAHTATGPRLLTAASATAICTTCHGAAGPGANTDVDNGVYLSSRDDNPPGANGNVGATNTPDNAYLLAGGFVNQGGAPTTSTHPMGATAPWGAGGTRGAKAAMDPAVLSCASCHDPHGSSNYRIFKTTVNGNGVTVTQVDEGAAKDYDTEQWPADMSNICAACHTAYHVTAAGSGSDAVEAANGGYTHRVDMPWNGDSGTDSLIGMGANNPETVGLGGKTLPLAASGVSDLVVCSTCHMSHGTSAAISGFAASNPGPSGNSALLRLDNRGVCEVCHQK